MWLWCFGALAAKNKASKAPSDFFWDLSVRHEPADPGDRLGERSIPEACQVAMRASALPFANSSASKAAMSISAPGLWTRVRQQ